MLGWIRVNQGKKRATFYVVVPWDRLDGSGQRKNWQFKYDRNGDRFESEAHAHRHLEYLRALIDDKAFNPFDWVEEKPHSFQNLQETYFRACLSIVKRDEMSPSTLKTKRRYWKLYFLPFFSGMDVKHIRNIHLRQFHDQLPATLKAKTRLNVVSDVEGFLGWCKEEEILKGAVPHYTGMKDLRKKAQKERPKPRKSTHMMGGDDFSKTLDQMSPSDRPIFEFLRITGSDSQKHGPCNVKTSTGKAVLLRSVARLLIAKKARLLLIGPRATAIIPHISRHTWSTLSSQFLPASIIHSCSGTRKLGSHIHAGR